MNLLQNYFEDKGVEYSKLDSDDRVTISDIMDEVDNIQSFLYDCSDEIVNTFKNVYNSVNAFYYELSEILKNEDDYNEAINNSDELTEQEKEILLKNEDLLDDIDNQVNGYPSYDLFYYFDEYNEIIDWDDIDKFTSEYPLDLALGIRFYCLSEVLDKKILFRLFYFDNYKGIVETDDIDDADFVVYGDTSIIRKLDVDTINEELNEE